MSELNYIAFPTMLYALGISSSIQLGILSLCINLPDGLCMNAEQLAEIFFTTDSNIRYQIRNLTERKFIRNHGNKFKPCYRAESGNIFRFLQGESGKYPRLKREGISDLAGNISRFLYKEENNNKKQCIKYNSQTFHFEGITAEQISDWQRAYPGVDIQQEILKAEQWLRASPDRRKKNYHRFLVNWFSRSKSVATQKLSDIRSGYGINIEN